MVKRESNKGALKGILEQVSYGTGVLCRKAANLGKITETKQWEKLSSGTQKLYGTVGDKTKDVFKKMEKNVHELEESFKEGMRSVSDEAVNPSDSKPKQNAVVSLSKQKNKIIAKGKVRASGQAKKVRAKVKVELDDKLEKEIEDITRNVEEV
jgi:hypothetical protein